MILYIILYVYIYIYKNNKKTFKKMKEYVGIYISKPKKHRNKMALATK